MKYNDPCMTEFDKRLANLEKTLDDRAALHDKISMNITALQKFLDEILKGTEK